MSEIFEISTPLNSIRDLTPLIEKYKDKKIIMLGESSHGTQEFYEWRRLISRELITKHGFNFISVEGDWPSCEKVNRFIKREGDEDTISVMNSFSRWPTWMWANTEVMRLMDELREWNEFAERPVGFHGLDVYSLYESIEEVIRLCDEVDPLLSKRMREFYSCFDPYKHDERAYVRSLMKNEVGCADAVAKALVTLLERNLENLSLPVDAIQNAKIVQNAERYYQAMLSDEDHSWNVRDTHMMETLDSLLEHHGPNSKAIVWAHNTHIGDFRATDMVVQGQINLGGLARIKYQEEVAIIGFTTYQGSVVASDIWDGEMETMTIPAGRENSLEDYLHKLIPEVSSKNYLLDFSESPLESKFNQYMGHRAVGVVYHPSFEHRGNYVPTIAAKRYDSLIFLDQTSAITPLNIKASSEKVPETFPFGDRV